MSDHLPECEAYRIECGGGCICHNVHACEQRVAKTGAIYYAEGFTAALDAAREAVLSLVPEIWREEPHVYEMNANDAISAIDALREGEK